MGLISVIKSIFGTAPSKASSPLPEAGNTEPVCPYCEADLEKMPGRKKKCPNCGEFIYVRTRPSDKKKILIREDQILIIEELWAIANDTYEQFLVKRKAYDDEKERLRLKFGKEPSENDIRWARLNKGLIKHAKEFQWGFYRNARLSMGDILKKESKELEALDTYLEVCYIDINGPNNCGTRDPQILKEYPPFNPKDAFLAPGVINYIHRLLENNNLTVAQAEERFLKVAQRSKQTLKLPVDASNAWKILEKEFCD